MEKMTKLLDENKKLRELLWLRHGCDSLENDYRTDAEMQCGRCNIDFKRDSARQITKRFIATGRKVLDKAEQQVR